MTLSSVMQPHSGGKGWIQRDLDRLQRWACTQLMRSNKAKGKILHPGQGNDKHKYRMDGGEIESSPEEEDLAGLVDWKLSGFRTNMGENLSLESRFKII